MTQLTLRYTKFRQVVTTKRLPLDVSVHLNLGKLTQRQRLNLVKALRRGVYWGGGGQSWTYRMLGDAFGFKTVNIVRRKAKTIDMLSIEEHWAVFCETFPDETMENLFRAEETARRLASWQPKGYVRSADRCLFVLHDKQLIEDMMKVRVTPAVEDAVRAVMEGQSIELKSEPIPSRFTRRPKK